MKLLHTADWHLGKSLHETSLIEDQRHMLEALFRELGNDDYAALIVAGDVYDRTIPGTDAVELFSAFLAKVRASFPGLEICVIPGNHDSAQRLSFADRVLEAQRIHIVGNPERSFEPIILRKSGETLAIFLLPFLSAGTLKRRRREATAAGQSDAQEFDFSDEPEDEPLLSQRDLAREAARRFAIARADPPARGLPSVLVAHLFAINGQESESERIFLGSAERIDPALFAGFSYVALGHLHRCQKVADRVRYSGSPLAYSFDEAGDEKGFLKIDIACGTEGFPVTATKIPLTPLHTVARLSGSFADFYAGTAYDAYRDEYLEITLTDETTVANPVNLLRPKFPLLLSLRQDIGRSETAGARAERSRPTQDESREGARRNEREDFSRFEELLWGEAPGERVELFASLLGEVADEA